MTGTTGKRLNGGRAVRWVARVWAVLTDLTICFFLYFGYGIRPEATWDQDAVDAASTMAYLGIGDGVVAGLTQGAFVASRRLHLAWLLVPLVLTALAVGRYLYVDQTYPHY
jgi:hypothetical protein